MIYKDIITHKDATNLLPGEITDAINSPLISQVQKKSSTLEGFKVGALKQDLSGILEFIAPSVRVSVTSQYAYSYKVVNGKDDLPKNNYEEFARGDGGEFGFIGYSDNKAVGQLKNYGLSTAVEIRDLEQEASFAQETFNRLVNFVDGAKVLKALGMLEATAGTNSYTIATTSNPIVQIEEKLDLTAQACGFYPNRILIGRGFWVKLHNVLTSGNNAWNFSAPKSVEELGDILGVEIMLPKARYKLGSQLPLIANNEMIAFVGESGLSDSDLSTMKTFNAGEMDFFEADHPQGKLKILTVNEYTDVRTTSTVGASKFTFAS